MRFELCHVEYMPKELRQGVLYVSERYGTAAHLCACGCGEKIRTPLGPTEWAVTTYPSGPTLMPSVGSWQRPCRSHYFIIEGQVRWAAEWTETAIEAGRRLEASRREAYFAGRANRGIWDAVKRWFAKIFR